jgi:hypothetical protein
MATNYKLSLRAICLIVIAGLLFAVKASALTVVVGQKVSPACLWDPSSGPPITNYLWTIPAYAVSNFYVAPDLSTGMVIEPFPLTNSTPEYYWVDGGNKKISCDITSMGQKLQSDGHINVIRPTIDFIGSINGTVELDTNYLGSSGTPWVHFGGSVNNGVTNWGINCTASNPNLQGYDTNSNAGFWVVQIITSDIVSGIATNGLSHTNAPVANELDNDYPVKNLGNGNGTVFSDCPGISGFPANYIQISKSQSFRTVLMFLPDESDYIPVPIKEIDWNWSASISFTNGQWVLTSSNATITVNNQDTLNFPAWTSVVKSQYF